MLMANHTLPDVNLMSFEPFLKRPLTFLQAPSLWEKGMPEFWPGIPDHGWLDLTVPQHPCSRLINIRPIDSGFQAYLIIPQQACSSFPFGHPFEGEKQ